MIEYLKFLFDFKITLVLVGLYLIYKYGKRYQNLHLKLGVDGPKPLPYLGNLIPVFRKGVHKMDSDDLQKYGRLYPFYFGNIPQIVVADEHLLKQIMIKEAKCFTDRVNPFARGKVTEKMLTVLNGKDWERVRALVSPTFTSGKLRQMTPLITDGVKLILKRLDQHPTDTPIDAKEFFGALTLDVIAQTMFGMKIDSQTDPNNVFIVNAKKLFSFSVFDPTIFLFLLFPELVKPIKILTRNAELRNRQLLNFFREAIDKAISKRQDSTEKYNDFLALMLRVHKEIEENDPEQAKIIGSKSLTNQEIMAQSLIFMLAGYETTASTLTHVSYFLAMNPSQQDEVYKEILDTFGIGGEINYELLMSMPLLEAAVNETLRICPPIARTDRKCTQSVTLTTSDNKSLLIRKGDNISVPIYAIHSDPSIWPEPFKFDLHRFDNENKKNHSPYSFIPFGMGPRNCVGMRFALLEIKWTIVSILQQFEIVRCAETPEKMIFKKTGFTKSARPILLKIRKR